MKKFKKGTIHLYIPILIFVFTTTFLYLFLNSKNRNQQNKAEGNALINNSPTPTEPTNSNWKTYVSRDYGFQINYPGNWSFTESENGINLTFAGPNSDDPGPQDITNIIIRAEENKLPLIETIKAEYKNTQENQSSIVNYNDIKPKELNEYFKGYYYNCDFLVHQECMYFPLSSKYHMRIMFNFADTQNRGYENTINQILSSLSLVKENENTLNLICPSNGWVNCMPGPDNKNSEMCSEEADTWYKANCPDYEGMAY